MTALGECTRCARRRVLCSLLGLVLLVLPLAAQGAPAGGEDASQFIEQALSNEKVAYVATRTSCVWSDSGTRALVATVYKDGDRARYEYPARGNQPGHVVIETDQAVYFIRPDARRVLVSHRKSDPDVDGGIRLKLALRNYLWRFEPSKSQRRRVVVAYRSGSLYPTQRFWVLVPQMVVLRSERYGPQGELRSSWSLDQVHFEESLPDSHFEPTIDPSVEQREIPLPVKVDFARVESTFGFRPVVFPTQTLPAGFELVEVIQEQQKTHRALRLVYSDGLESFSLLESPLRPRSVVTVTDARKIQILDRPAQVATSVEANVVAWQDGSISLSLVGSQPEAQMVSLARSLISSLHPPEVVVPPPRPSLGQYIARGWERLMRLLGLG